MTSSARPSNRVILVIILFHQILASFAFPVAKIGLAQLDPLVYAFFRFTISSLIFALVIYFAGDRTPIEKKDRWRLLGVGLLVIPLNQLLFLVGQALTLAGHGSLLFATTPIFIYLLAIMFLGERLKLRKSIGILTALAGVMIVMWGGKLRFGREYLVGDLIIMLSVISWAMGTVIGKPLAEKYGALRATGLALISGSLVYFPFGLYLSLGADYSRLTWSGWLSILYLAVMMSTVAYVIWYWVLKYFEASRVAVIQNIQPIIATAAAAVILSEPISRNFIIGGLIAIVGVLLTEIK